MLSITAIAILSPIGSLWYIWWTAFILAPLILFRSITKALTDALQTATRTVETVTETKEALLPTKKRRCSICLKPGHTKPKCPYWSPDDPAMKSSQSRRQIRTV